MPLHVLLFLASFLRLLQAEKLALHSAPLSSCGLSPEIKATSQKEAKAREGTPADALETLPWQVSIESEDEHVCGGAILSSWWILSAAHCFLRNFSSDLQIVVNSNEDAPGERKVDRVVIHEDFNGVSLVNDIALIPLDSPIDLSEVKTSICLPLLHDLGTWQDCWVAAWRPITADDNAESSSLLREVEMTLISREACSEKVPELTGDVLCAVSEEGGKEACKDNISGSPLVCTYGSGTIWFVVGVGSQGASCDGEESPAIYTVVFSYLDWIQRATAREGKPFIPEGVDNLADQIGGSVPDLDSTSGSLRLSAASALAPVLLATLFCF